MKKVVVVGAGVIGLLCAHELRRRGAEVTVVDKGAPGKACSLGNTGWIVPSSSAPLPAPGVFWTAAKWMLRADSPLYIRPRAVPALAGWLWQFRGYCNGRHHDAGRDAVARLNRQTMPLFDALQRNGVRFEMHSSGLLCAFSTMPALRRTLASLQAIATVRDMQIHQLAAAETREQEPALSDVVAGGVLIEGERHVRPESLNRGLVDWLKESGAEIRCGVEALDVRRREGAVIGIESTHGRIDGDEFIIAAGAWSGRFAKRLGFRQPLQAGKGYSITIDHPTVRLRRPLYLPESKIVCSPFDGALRIGGTMELSGINDDLDTRRLAAIRGRAQTYLPGWQEGSATTEWVGMRPLTPDGLPIIGSAPGYGNVYVATGHAMLGVTLGPATASAIADLILSGGTDTPLAPFDPARFA